MKCYVGIDLGSTTTKAVVLDEERGVLGRGITNSRSNYDVACQVASGEAMLDARLRLFERAVAQEPDLAAHAGPVLEKLRRAFRRQQHLVLLRELEETVRTHASAGEDRARVLAALERVFEGLREQASTLFGERSRPRSDFFRDVVGAGYVALAEGDLDTAQSLYEEALEALGGTGDELQIAVTLTDFARLATRKGDLEAARARFATTLEVVRGLKARREAAYGLEGTAGLAAAREEVPVAVWMMGAAAALREAIGSPMAPAEAREQAALMELLRARLGEEAFAAHLASGRRLEFDPVKETFVKDPEADRMLTREYRQPFALPDNGGLLIRLGSLGVLASGVFVVTRLVHGFRAGFLGLLHQLHAQVVPGDRLGVAGEVGDALDGRDLPADSHTVDDDGAGPSGGCMSGSRQTCGTRPDDDDVVHSHQMSPYRQSSTETVAFRRDPMTCQ